MSITAEGLMELLPAVHRLRDDREGGLLRELMSVIADQLAVVEEDVESLHDDQFVETCAPWVLPYLGDLIGITGLPAPPLAPRAEVGHTIGLRRRKGTAAALEQLAGDVTGLRARAVEFLELLATTQFLNHLRPESRAMLSLRDARRLERIDGPFERLAGAQTITHTADVRRIGSGRGRYDIPNVGVFLWRVGAGRLTRSPLVPAGGGGGERFRLHPLGVDAPLVNPPRTEDEFTHLADPVNVPEVVSRRVAAAAPDDYYGDGRSVLLELPPVSPATVWTAIPAADVAVCHLGDWGNVPAAGTARAYLDPELGRVVLPAAADRAARVTVHHALAARSGGGEYDRRLAPDPRGTVPIRVPQDSGLSTAVQAASGGGVVEITDSGRYKLPGGLAIAAGSGGVTLRAAPGARPVLELALGEEISVSGDAEGRVELDGLLIVGGPVVVKAPTAPATGLGRLSLRHLTLVPGLSLNDAGGPATPGAQSLVVHAPATDVRVERSILGAVGLHRDARMGAVDAIIDANAQDRIAVGEPGDTGVGGALSLEGVTVIGRVRVDALDLVSNSVLLARATPPERAVEARRRQEGCIRFSYVPPGSRTPRRHRCQPAADVDPVRVRPALRSARYPGGGYGRLADVTAREILRGAEDESEMGAFHHLHLQQREAHLRTRLDEHTRFGLEAGVLHAGDETREIR